MTSATNGGVRVFDHTVLDDLTARAKASPRLRQHQNIHTSLADPCQRLLNAIEPGSYLRPKRDVSVPRSKLLVALRGRFALLCFDDGGNIQGVTRFAANGAEQSAVAIDVAPACWNTVVSLESGSVLLEARPGPFDPVHLGDFAPWAPEVESADAVAYSAWLQDVAKNEVPVAAESTFQA